MYQKAEEFTREHYQDFLEMNQVIIVSDGAGMGIAREAALKFGETLKIPALYYESEEYIHGPNMQLTPEYAVFFVDTNKNHNRMQEIFAATGRITQKSYVVTNKRVENKERVCSVENQVRNEITPLFTGVLFQYIAAVVTEEKNQFQCHPLFEKFEERIHCKTKDYKRIMKEKEKKVKRMRKYVVAAHGRMAEGIRSTVELIVGPQENLICINAYTEECQDPMPEFQRILAEYPEDEVVIMTDLLGGSVNNNALTLTREQRVHVVTGMSLALVIGMLMSDQEEDTKTAIEKALAEAREGMVYCENIEAEELEDDEF
ncbi:hypothetical protein C806_01724 [Lachnospiraceae bacterium 3-1]|nr:hypothetical protein C806_01724 [Lachnospiraceae bacterium 3-1]